MTILLNNNGYDNDSWQRELERRLPGRPIKRFGESLDPAEITYAMVWDHPRGDLKNYPNLRAIFSLGAGAEHFISDPSLPEVPVVLLADPTVARDMAAHSLYWVMHFHRRYGDYDRAQETGRWYRHPIPAARETQVLTLGLGRIGTEVARSIALCGYDVVGWDHAPRVSDGIRTYTGLDGLSAALANTQIIINCLPLTPDTRHMLDARVFDMAAKGAAFINISRGAIVDDDALLAALDSGQISAAALDAFAIEPLPQNHQYWSHPKVHVTPHMSGATYASTAAQIIVDNLCRFEKGEQPYPLFDRNLGY